MKKWTVLLSALLLLTLCACGGTTEDGLQLESAGSELYTEEDLNDAAQVVRQCFQEKFSGCTLTALRYPGDQTEVFQRWAERYDADQAVVVTSDFDVDESGGDGSLNPNSTYSDWEWVLVRDEGGQWTVQTWGY